jgi:aquaporin Z
MDGKTMLTYWVAQFVGAAIGAGILLLIASGKADYDVALNGLGQNGWGPGYLGEYTLAAAIVFEIVATFLFLVVILGSTQTGAPTAMAGLSIGLTLTAIHIVRHPGDRRVGQSGAQLRSGAVCRRPRDVTLWLFLVAPSLAQASQA